MARDALARRPVAGDTRIISLVGGVRQECSTISVSTKGRGFYEITREIERLVSKSGIKVGLSTVHIQHTSASLLI
ncbi:MAG TPA: YjbQ family protein, partial [Candidatus Kapabacteria bacterium]|nr:YjbQ family protein [Candidatus Kapabacteria bacterium]